MSWLDHNWIRACTRRVGLGAGAARGQRDERWKPADRLIIETPLWRRRLECHGDVEIAEGVELVVSEIVVRGRLIVHGTVIAASATVGTLMLASTARWCGRCCAASLEIAPGAVVEFESLEARRGVATERTAGAGLTA